MTDRQTDGQTDGRQGKNNMSPDREGGRHNYEHLETDVIWRGFSLLAILTLHCTCLIGESLNFRKS